MDLKTITDQNELKSLAYDQIVALETAKANLRALQDRMKQLQEAPQKPVESPAE